MRKHNLRPCATPFFPAFLAACYRLPIFRNNADQENFSAEDYYCGSSCPGSIGVFSLSPLVKGVNPMFRMALGVGSVAILLVATGCQMCCHSYDDAGPVFSEDGCPSSAHSRAGSIFAGVPQASLLPTTNQTPDEPASASPTPAPAKKKGQSALLGMSGSAAHGWMQAQPQPGDVPGSRRIVSVTDRAVKPSTDSPQATDERSPESSRQLPATGWTARRPSTELLR